MRNKKRYYRKFDLDVSREEVERIVREYADPEKYSHSVLAGPYTPPDTDALTGRTLAFRGEEKNYDFRFTGLNELWFREDGAEEKRCFCNVKTLDGEVFLVNFLVPGYAASRQVTLIPDLKSGCATVVDAHIGTEHSNIDVDRDFYFGRLEGDFAGGPLHGFTTELVGKSVSWNYGYFDIAHVYATEHYYRVSFTPRGLARAYRGRPELRKPAARKPSEQDVYEDYFTPIKIREHIYLVGLLETVKARQQGNGNSILALIDLEEMHDVGRSFGSNREGGNGNNTFGAFGVMHDASAVLAKPSTLYVR